MPSLLLSSSVERSQLVGEGMSLVLISLFIMTSRYGAAKRGCWQHMTHLMQGQCAAAPVHHVGVSNGFDAQVQWIEEAPTRRVAQRERSPGKKKKIVMLVFQALQPGEIDGLVPLSCTAKLFCTCLSLRPHLHVT